MSRGTRIGLICLWFIALCFGLDIKDWQYIHDTPLLNYAGWLMAEHGHRPYRDFFETSMPGTFLVHAAIIKLNLDGNTAFIALGLGLLAALGWVGSAILVQIHKASAPLFALAYITFMLLFGAASILQRELIITLFISLACLIAFKSHRTWPIGVLFSLAALIKPQLALTAPIIVIASILLHQTRPFPRIIQSLVGFALPICACLVWLYAIDALPQFRFLVTKYLPLHIQQSTFHVFMETPARLKYLVKAAIHLGDFWILAGGPLLLAVLQYLNRSTMTREHHIKLGAILAMTASFSVIPVISGQFWDYHYFPYIFFAILCAVTCLGLARRALSPFLRVATGIGALAFPALQGIFLYDPEIISKNNRDMKVVTDMQAALERHLPAGGKVQPIDWTKGAIHAMLRERVLIATPFFYDYHFHHHFSGEITTQLRAEFLTALNTSRPELLLEVPTRPRMKGFDTSYDWPALDTFISENYRIVETGEHHVIHLRLDH